MVQHPSYWKVLTRRKILSTEGGETETKLNRVLGLYDLTALGVGSTLGAGVYVLAGQIAKEQAGPSVVLSFAIAALASLFAGVCYAEFGARVPKAGSAYVYSYVCIGEFAAFVIGWNLILEYVIGTAAVCRGISLYLDTLINDTLKMTFAEITPMEVSFLGSYFDLFAFGLVVVFGVALAFGVETSAMANNFCTCLNISILLFVIVAGSIKANFENWAIDVNVVNATAASEGSDEVIGDLGAGGFFPFGITGTLKGAATCFFGFVGFDCIATTGEEVRNPRKNIPRSILLSLLVIFLCYFGVSMVLTLMVPYYRQDPNAPLPYAFKEVGWTFAMWIVSIGGLIGLLASLFGALFPLPRIMYSMAEDGLLFRFLGKVSPRFKVPVQGSIFAAVLTALIAGLFDLSQLVSLLSIGTLLAYSVVAISITILRYMDNAADYDKVNGHQPITETTMLTTSGARVTWRDGFVQLFNCKRLRSPNTVSTRIVGTLMTLFCLLSMGVGLVLMNAYDALISNQLWVLILFGVLVALAFLVLVAICLQPREIFAPRISVFRVPFVPFVPAVSVFINIYLMLQLDVMTWIRFGVWMIIGIPMYLACYCMNDLKNPEKRNSRRVAFEKALRSSGNDNSGNDKTAAGIEGNDCVDGRFVILTPNNLEAMDTLKINGQLKSQSAQNQLSLRSLDEIVKMSDIGEDLIEMRHPNGKVFYIEDTRSNASVATLDRDEKEENGIKATASEAREEEEKNVIALLDDVLQGEDDGGMLLATPETMNDYGRKFSIDSEMLPSVIETTIVATVHSSSDSSEHDLDDVPEDNEEQATMATTTTTLAMQLEYRNQCERLAKELVEDLLKSEAIQSLLRENPSKPTREIENESENENENIEPRSQPTSELSPQSIEDPLHSDFFKNKLSQLILAKANRKESEHEETLRSARPKLKQSKSESDVKKTLRKLAESNDETKNGSETSTPSYDPSIPRPPKFDPVLYKTLNSLNTNRSRPGLDRLIAADADNGIKSLKNDVTIKIDVEKESENQRENSDETVPFKTKLEALLRRGPSHRSQRRPSIEIRPPRPKTMIEAPSNHYNEYESQENPVMLRKKPTNDTKTAESAKQLILHARQTLKPIQNGAATAS